MRYAVLSDVHRNLEALEAVLADAATRTDTLLCLGDLVGYGADPVACVEMVAGRAQTITCGNHEQAVAGGLDLDWFNPHARAAAEWTFSYVVTDAVPRSTGRSVRFRGMSIFELEGGRIARYREYFDTGAALLQLGFAPESLAKVLARRI